ncbi:mitotic spindle checkpoint protein MAD2-like [Arabidopsis lyrata subsp. lyrata]|uniref:mitotic spindle checkpoint protein MAD2-like n=1 Tax=Arabidopsis lyrata subsp. lyrata TaxID=81972 RepID=UPI000A29E105|nr:mitotic spindle checkpoint protein MAD2-like [Arabidopsis lyrata subsp. lyrata]|eukprot:XP_020867872.1 mitotic spindle checkpoint protein MAD2-like [Arabidopsis lyrata subsp. lyrata]
MLWMFVMFYAVLILSLSFHCVSRNKSDQEITREIQAIMRKVASSITSLPCLHETCVSDVLAYTDTDVAVPFTWIESDPKLIESAESDSQGRHTHFIQEQQRG